MSSSHVKDKHSEPIRVGDTVASKARGGRQYGEVTDIVTTKEEAEEAGAKNPPKVLYEDQHGHLVSHNPGTVVHGEDPTK
ncbi:uncharacterized protein SCHCODRAFT_02512770 [Schizophyllum commune H4-8]|uniref:Hypervirulence associated protein TUDOR domain-containing protein n=1 Tax=Schizophyllum commune (strain H4-8 / FGSC 9210) TaxID=578458 RepID=D8QEP0_SCHCM|nr:uncharacterized protein SCHCODRAFT_02512770 [Schizophyllum commune H4-8]KAI5888204.1 hypothetical protein SCHCODRAFT_02512770 [Schizophyllum commune H4-8]